MFLLFVHHGNKYMLHLSRQSVDGQYFDTEEMSPNKYDSQLHFLISQEYLCEIHIINNN